MTASKMIKTPKIKIPWMLIFPFFIFTVGTIILGRVYYSSQLTRINNDAIESLTSISQLKIDQIELWHNERLGNTEQIRNNNPLLKSLKQYINNKNQPETEADIRNWMDYMAERLDYNGAFIYDTLLNSRLAARQSVSVLPESTRKVCMEVLKDLNTRMTDLYRNGPSSRPAIDIVIPLVLNNTKKSRPFGVIVLRIDPEKTLFPLIQSWPTPSKSAETLLIRKDGDSVLYLNDLRHIQNTALSLKFPISDIDLPAAKAVNGFMGVVNGVDYREKPVLSFVSSLPDLSWFMVAKIDKDEILAPLERLSIISVSVTILFILFIGAVLLFWMRTQQFIQSREHLKNELERKQLDEALIISEARYRRLFEAARDGILILEAETGLIVDVNPYLVEMLGVSREQFLKKSIWEIGFFKDIAANKDKFLELQQKEYVRYEDLPLETSDGRKFHVEFVSNVYQVSGYNVIQCNIRDITKRKEMTDELNKQNSMINALLANLQIGVYMIEVPSGIPLLANESSFNLLGRGILPEANSGTIAKVYDLYKTGTDIPYPNEELPLIVAMSGVSKHVDDMEVKKPDGTRIALEVFGSPIRDNSGNIWASLVSFQDITDRKQAEEALKLSEGKFRQLVNNTDIGFVVVDDKGIVVEANDPYLKLAGYGSFEEISGRSVLEWTAPEEVENNASNIALCAKQGSVQNFETVYLRADGTRINIILDATMQSMPDGKMLNVAFCRNITDRKLALDTLKKSEAEFRNLAESMPQIVWATRADGWNIYFNRQWMDYTGMTIEESSGHGWNKPFHPDDQQRAWDAWINAVENNSIYSIEARLRRFDGEYRWWLVRGVPQINEKGKILKWFGTCTDIEEIKQTEKAINESEVKQKEAQRIAHLGNWELNIETNELVWSDEIYRIFNCEPNEFEATYEAFLEFIHPDDREKVNAAYLKSLETKTDYQIEHRIITKNNQQKYVKEKCTTTFNEQGNPLNSFGIVIDITESKQAEEEIKSKVAELERFNRLSVGREMRMIELKQKINDLSAQLKIPQPYTMDYIKSTDDIPDIGKKGT